MNQLTLFGEEKKLINFKEASEWASKYLNRKVTVTNISYLIQYGRIIKYGTNGNPLINIEEFDEEIVKELRDRAVSTLEKEEHSIEPSDDLLSMKGMDRDLAYRFAARGVKTMEDLAEQSVDDLMEIENISEEKAKELIMTAREPWFK